LSAENQMVCCDSSLTHPVAVQVVKMKVKYCKAMLVKREAVLKCFLFYFADK